MSEYIRKRLVWYHGEVISMADDVYRIKQNMMFMRVWNEREHRCSVSKQPLTGGPLSYYFHHIIEKRAYEKYSLCKWNITLLNWDIHNSYESKPDNQPLLYDLRAQLLFDLEVRNVKFDNDVIFNAPSGNHIADVLPGILISVI